MKALILSAALLFTGATVGSASSPLVSAPAAETEFLKEFRSLMKINAKDKMAALVKQKTDEAVAEIIRICEEIGRRTDEELETDIEALRVAWKTAKKSDFVAIQYEFHSLLRPEFKKERTRVKREGDKITDRFVEAWNAKDVDALLVLGPQLAGHAEEYEALEDYYEASQCWLNAASCYSDEIAGERARLRQACEAYGRAIQARERIELKDSWYDRAKVNFEGLTYRGFGDPSQGPEARREEKKKIEAAHSVSIDLAFEVFADLEQVARPIYNGDLVYQAWPALGLQEKGSTLKFPFIEDSPDVVRSDAAKAHIALAGGELEIPVSGNISPVTFDLPSGDPWAFLAVVGRTEDIYQGFQYYMAPSDQSMAIYMAPAASMVGLLGETSIRILDDNMDGVYGSRPVQSNHFGLVDGVFQWDMDSIVIGDEKRALPWSEVVQVGGEWYRFERLDDGGLSATPTAVETGTLKLDFKGGFPDYLIFQGDGLQSDYFFDVAQDKSGVEVPEGKYSLLCGRFSKGKRDQVAKALILPGAGMSPWVVQAGATTKVELGGPFGMDFEFSQSDESVEVKGETIVVTGRGGERYLRLWNCVLQPDVLLRPAGKKKGKKEDSLRSAKSQAEVLDHGLKGAWFPLTAQIEKKKSEPVEVQLFEKKNKLFGKIESAWKP